MQAKLYPDYIVAHMPTEYIQDNSEASPESRNDTSAPERPLVKRQRYEGEDAGTETPETSEAPVSVSIPEKRQRLNEDAQIANQPPTSSAEQATAIRPQEGYTRGSEGEAQAPGTLMSVSQGTLPRARLSAPDSPPPCPVT